MRARCLADRTFGIGTSAPSMRRARLVAETGTPAGMMGPVLSRGGGRSPAWPRGSRGSGSRGDAEAHARGTLPGKRRHDARPELRARREDAVESRQRVARRWKLRPHFAGLPGEALRDAHARGEDLYDYSDVSLVT
jgi:hypothetical protein